MSLPLMAGYIYRFKEKTMKKAAILIIFLCVFGSFVYAEGAQQVLDITRDAVDIYNNLSGNSSGSSSSSSSGSTYPAQNTSNKTITIVNNTGYPIRGAQIRPSGAYWASEDIIIFNNQVFQNGATFSINLDNRRSQASRCDIMIVDTDFDRYVKWNVSLVNGSRIVFTFNDFVGQEAPEIAPR
jgi:hypothetical protein